MNLIKWSLIAGAAILTSAPTLAATCKDGSSDAWLAKAGSPYVECVMSTATKLEVSGEAPDDISRAAINQCEDEGKSLEAAFARCAGDQNARGAMLHVYAQMHDEVVSRIVTIRAARKSRGG